MQQPPAFTNNTYPHKVCHLKKTLYGLKQSGRQWYQWLCKILVDNLGFTCCDVDQSIFFKSITPDLIIILVHIDDCTIIATTIKLVDWVKKGERVCEDNRSHGDSLVVRH